MNSFIGPILVDWSVSFGNMLTMVGMLSTVIWFASNLKGEIKIIKNDMHHLEVAQSGLSDAFRQLGTILTQVAIQDARISMIEKDVQELRHGDGYIEKR